MEPQPTAEIFPHVRIVMGMVIGLGVTRLLSGLARIVQHPRHFWWWEFGLFGIRHWTFEIYFFIVLYAVTLFLLCALLFPDSMEGYTGYEDYFYARRAWFFGLLAATYLFDVVDTLIKGEAHFARFGVEYLIRTPVFVLLCLIAIRTSDRRFHRAFIAFTLIYQISWILRLFSSIG